MEQLAAVPRWYTSVVQGWIREGYLDGDLLLVPTVAVYFVIGAVLAHWLFMGPFGALVFADAGEPRKLGAANTSGNSTRSGMRRSAKETGRRRRSCPDDLELKMVLVVRKDLKLKAPDVAVHCAQAAIDAVALATNAPMPPDAAAAREPETPEEEAAERRGMWRQWLEWWNEEGVAKVVLKADGAEALADIAGECTAMGLPFVKVADAVVA
eukprot:CAMPEP_0174869444 /NCGR_PEP_ID=MMETSP1114-20130205/67886_1 /TAXON_ID=312471 /ORGANISM="Neobodo designis, Strain CCAP 1951/1" /LENGTH=210 /DNA_ID=CAMNT_0016104689 /DNA_START=52 /DNA_END=680 /DNA_ORIENTATION=+